MAENKPIEVARIFDDRHPSLIERANRDNYAFDHGEDVPLHTIKKEGRPMVSDSEIKARFLKDGETYLVHLDYILNKVGREKLDLAGSSSNRDVELHRAKLIERAGQLLVQLPEALSLLVGGTVLFTPVEKLDVPHTMYQLESAVMHAELLQAKLAAFLKDHPTA